MMPALVPNNDNDTAELLRLRLIIDTAGLGTWEWDVEADRLALSPRARDILGCGSADCRSLQRFLASILHDYVPAVAASFQRLRNGAPDRQTVEFRTTESEDATGWIRLNAVGLKSADGAVGRVVGTLDDVSLFHAAQDRLEQALAEKEMLLREVNHRVKNSLQLVASLLALEAASSGDRGVRQAFDDACGRVVTVARLHERLYDGPVSDRIALASYLPDLVRDLGHSLGLDSGPVRLSIEMSAEPYLPADRTVALALIVNELVTNTVKHAFPDGRTGQVDIRLLPGDDGAAWMLEIRDDGVGLPPDMDLMDSPNLGLRLVKTLCRQIGGKLTAQSVAEGMGTGTRVRIAMPTPG